MSRACMPFNSSSYIYKDANYTSIFWNLNSLLLLSGCSAKHPFCKSNPCQNGGTCSVSWETFSCDCPVGHGGKDCSQGERLILTLNIQVKLVCICSVMCINPVKPIKTKNWQIFFLILLMKSAKKLQYHIFEISNMAR